MRWSYLGLLDLLLIVYTDYICDKNNKFQAPIDLSLLYQTLDKMWLFLVAYFEYRKSFKLLDFLLDYKDISNELAAHSCQ